MVENKKKLIWIIVLIAFTCNLLPCLTHSVFAAPENPNPNDLSQMHDADNKKTDDNEDSINEDDIDEKYKGQTVIERMIASIFTSLTLGIYDILQIKDPLALIFDYQKDPEKSRDNLQWGIFTDEEMKIVSALYDTFQRYLPIWLCVMVVLVGLMLVFAGFGGDPRTTAKQYISGILLVCFLFAYGPKLMDMVFDAAYVMVEIINALVREQAAARGVTLPQSLLGALLAGFMHKDTSVFTAGFDLAEIMSRINLVSGLMYAIILFLTFVGAGLLNWQYIVRKITLAILIFMFPFCAGMAVFPNTRGVLRMWFSEFFANVFLVTAHAIVYGFLILVVMSPGKTLSPLEIIIFLVGINGVVGIVRGMFGAQQSGKGMGSILGISSLMGVGRMAMNGYKGWKGKTEGIAGSPTDLSKSGSNDMPSSSVVPDARLTNKIAEKGDNLTPNQASLIESQLSGNELSEREQMELNGPHKDLNLEEQKEQMNKDTEGQKPMSFGRKAAMIGGALTAASVGALASGAVTGQSAPGLAAGALGAKAAGGALNTTGNIKKAVTNPQSMGIYGMGQLMDVKSATEIGRRIAGSPGAAIASTASRIATGIGGKTPESVFADGIRENISENYDTAQQKYLESQQKMQLAQHHLQDVDFKYPVEERENSISYQQELAEANDNLLESKRQFNVDAINLKQAEIMRQNEHDYVGMELRMMGLSQKPPRSSGHI